MILPTDLSYFEKIILKHNEEVFFEDFIMMMNKPNNEYYLSKLRQFAYIFRSDLELREKILNLALLALIYSVNTIPEYAKKRAKNFTQEFNEYYGEKVNLSCDKIDCLINEAYGKNDNEKKLTKYIFNIKK